MGREAQVMAAIVCLTALDSGFIILVVDQRHHVQRHIAQHVAHQCAFSLPCIAWFSLFPATPRSNQIACTAKASCHARTG